MESKKASVTFPGTSASPVHLQDVTTGMAADVSLRGALPVPAQAASGYVVYPAALAGVAHLLHRAMPNGMEDFIALPSRPATAEVDYAVTLGGTVAGLRLVGGVLELLDAAGAPRLHVSPPYIVGADGTRTDGALAVTDCAVDTDPSPPWGRPVTAPGAATCTIQVTWPDDAVTYPAILDPRWTTTGSMATTRFEHTLILLSTGKGLAAGGRSSTSSTTGLTSAELYDPASGTWSSTGSMSGGRRLHSATQLPTSSNPTTSGKVLVAGGISSSTSLTTAELYSTSTGTWSAAGALNAGRHAHTATLLVDGRVLVAGGMNGTTTLATAATYNPASGSGVWAATTGPIPPAGLKNHTATLVQTTNSQLNNHVLLVGGNDGTSTLSAVYLYDPVQNAFSTLASISGPREQHTAAVLPNSNGKILVTGGKNGSTVLATALVFDPSFSNGSWSSAGTMTSPRVGHTMTLLPNSIVANGQVLVAGGSSGTSTLSSAELFSDSTTWTATPSMPGPLQGHQVVLLSGNMVLVAGGLSASTTVSSAAYLYDASFGLGCSSNSQCASGFCINGICCNNACNTGTCGACNLAGHLGTCTPLAAGTVCRAAAGACDVAETCNGTAFTCPSDGFLSSTTTCRAAAGECDVAENCTGTTASCPADVKKASGTACTDDGNACTTDKCDGTNVTCQHAAGNAGAVCRPAAGGCDVAETCTGTSTACPTDVLVSAGTTCRGAAGECDLAESCSGTSAACPADAKKGNGTPCTDDGNVCTKDQCDGTNVTCQHPAGNAGTICRAAAGSCDVAEACTGTSTTCPANAFLSSSTVCRTAAGECDLAETCTGSSASCPADAKKASGTACTDDGNVCTKDQCDGTNVTCQHPAGNAETICRGSAGPCDVAEACTGSSAACPPDAFQPTSTICRIPQSQCDLAEFCTGSAASCPPDLKSPDGTACDDGNACTLTDTCLAGACSGSNPPNCDDDNSCTTDTCDQLAGCQHAAIAGCNSRRGRIEAESFDSTNGVVVNPTSVTPAGDGSWIRFDNVDFGSPGDVGRFQVALLGSPGDRHLELHLDSATGQLIADLFSLPSDPVAPGPQSTALTAAVSGLHTVVIVFRAADTGALDWFSLEPGVGQDTLTDFPTNFSSPPQNLDLANIPILANDIDNDVMASAFFPTSVLDLGPSEARGVEFSTSESLLIVARAQWSDPAGVVSVYVANAQAQFVASSGPSPLPSSGLIEAVSPPLPPQHVAVIVMNNGADHVLVKLFAGAVRP
jgi:hypothetical protein